MSAISIQTLYQGDTAYIEFELVEPDGAKLNLTGCIITWSLALASDLDSPVLEKTSATAAVQIVSAINGTCMVTIPAGELATPGTYIHEIEATHPSGATYTYGQGQLIIKGTLNPS